MNNKKIIMYICIVILILAVMGAGFLVYKNNKKNKSINQEYIPQKEITDEQLRQTVITLYFLNLDTGTIMRSEKN